MPLQINQLIKFLTELNFEFNLENFTRKAISMIVIAVIAVIRRPLLLCMHNIKHMYWLSNQVVVACTLVVKSFGSNLDEKLL